MATRTSRADPRAQLVFMLVVVVLAITVWSLVVQARAVLSPGPQSPRPATVTTVGAVGLLPSGSALGFHHGQVKVGRLPSTEASQVPSPGPRHRPKWGP